MLVLQLNISYSFCQAAPYNIELCYKQDNQDVMSGQFAIAPLYFFSPADIAEPLSLELSLGTSARSSSWRSAGLWARRGRLPQLRQQDQLAPLALIRMLLSSMGCYTHRDSCN